MACNNQRGIVNISQLPMEVDLSNTNAALGLDKCGNVLKIPINLVENVANVQDLFWSIDANSNLDLNVVLTNGVTKQISVPNVSTNSVGVIGQDMYNQIIDNKNAIEALSNIGGRWIGQTFNTNAALMAAPIDPSWKSGDYTYVQQDETQNGHTTLYYFNGTTWIYALIIDTIVSTQMDKFTSTTLVGNVYITSSTNGLSVNYTVWTYNTSTQTWSSSVYGWNVGLATDSQWGFMSAADKTAIDTKQILTTTPSISTTNNSANLVFPSDTIAGSNPQNLNVQLPIASPTSAGMITSDMYNALGGGGGDNKGRCVHNFPFSLVNHRISLDYIYSVPIMFDSDIDVSKITFISLSGSGSSMKQFYVGIYSVLSFTNTSFIYSPTLRLISGSVAIPSQQTDINQLLVNNFTTAVSLSANTVYYVCVFNFGSGSSYGIAAQYSSNARLASATNAAFSNGTYANANYSAPPAQFDIYMNQTSGSTNINIAPTSTMGNRTPFMIFN